MAVLPADQERRVRRCASASARSGSRAGRASRRLCPSARLRALGDRAPPRRGSRRARSSSSFRRSDGACRAKLLRRAPARPVDALVSAGRGSYVSARRGSDATRPFLIGERLFHARPVASRRPGLGIEGADGPARRSASRSGASAASRATAPARSRPSATRRSSVQEFARVYDQAQRNAQQSGRQVSARAGARRSSSVRRARGRGGGLQSRRLRRPRGARRSPQNPTFQGAGRQLRPRPLHRAPRQCRHRPRRLRARDVRRELVRDQIAEIARRRAGGAAAAGRGALPVAERGAHRLLPRRRRERRSSRSARPTDSALQTYFDENQRAASARRNIASSRCSSLDPAALADPAAVTDEDVAAEYERRKASFTQPERRRIEQIRFDTRGGGRSRAAEARRAARISPRVATARRRRRADIDQGLKTKAEILDPAVAEAAFAAAAERAGRSSKDALEPSLIRVTEIEPGSVTPLAEAAPRIRQDLATARRARAGAASSTTRSRTSAPAAPRWRRSRKTCRSPTASSKACRARRHGAGRQRRSPIFPPSDAVVAEAFESDVGVENSPVRAGEILRLLRRAGDRSGTRPHARRGARRRRRRLDGRRRRESRIAEKADALLGRLQKRRAARRRSPPRSASRCRRSRT